jgi:hypothetical protein
MLRTRQGKLLISSTIPAPGKGITSRRAPDLEADAVVQIGAGHWLRIPLGKLRNDRYEPLPPS